MCALILSFLGSTGWLKPKASELLEVGFMWWTNLYGGLKFKAPWKKKKNPQNPQAINVFHLQKFCFYPNKIFAVHFPLWVKILLLDGWFWLHRFRTSSQSTPFHACIRKRCFGLRFEGSQGVAAHRVLYTQQGKTNKESFETEQLLPHLPTQSRGADGRAWRAACL